MKNKNLQPIRGTRDIVGVDIEIFNHIIDVSRRIANNYGYDEIQTPIFESSDVFLRTLGDTSDIVSKETYTFMDRDKTSITLRPEFSAQIVRSIISNGLTQSLPQKLFCYGPLFRHERPQAFRYRQLHQINYEFIGVKSGNSDVEVIATAKDVLSGLGIWNDVVLEINSLGDRESRIKYKASLIKYFTKYKSDLSVDSLNRLDKNPLRILDSKDEGDIKISYNAPTMKDSFNLESQKSYEEVLNGLDDLSIKYKQTPQLVRGLDYYTNTVFEFTTQILGSQASVLGGGRYDELIEQMGGPSIPAIGFAAGIERLSGLIKAQDKVLSKPKVFYLLPIGDKAMEHANQLAYHIRSLNLRLVMDYSGNLNKRFKRANDVGAAFTLILGDSELDTNTIKIKNMSSGIEEIVNLYKLEEYLTKQT